MANFHCDSGFVKRSKGGSAVASAAYRAADKLTDERTGLTHDYTAKHDVIHAEIMLPAGAPDRLSKRSTLWNEVERHERRKDSQVAFEVRFSLPRELPNAEAIGLAREIAAELYVSKGLVVDVAVHRPMGKDGDPQPHAHLLIATRYPTADGFGIKAPELQVRHGRAEMLRDMRERIAVGTNFCLARNGFSERVDHRSYKERGIRLEPQTKVGPAAARRGAVAERMAKHKAVSRDNGERIIADPTIAIDALFEHQSTVTHADIAKFVSRHTVDDEQFQHAYAKVRAHPDLVVVGRCQDGNERFSTREIVAMERAMVEHADTLVAESKHGLSWLVARRALKGTTLGPEQQEAFKHVTDAKGLALVAGIAGTGKSRMLDDARKAWEASGYRVRGATISGIAAEGLEASSGIRSRTLASLEYDWSRGRDLPTKRDVLVIDEAGMVGSRQMGRLLAMAKEAGSKVVLVGDADQLQPIAAGSAFRALSERHGVAHLSAVRRQRSPWMREATKELATARTRNALERYEAAGMVHETRTREDARGKLVEMWAHDREHQPDRTSLILAHTRADVAALNELAREKLKASSALTGPDVTLTTERGKRDFAVGDRVLFLKNDRALGIKNGSIGTVRELTPDRMTVQLDDGTKQGAGRLVAFNPNAYSHLEHGYATTVHKAQGTTVQRACVLATPGMDRTISYVAMTRHTKRADLVYAREDFREGFADMAHMLGRDGRKDTTLDYRQAEKMMAAKPETDFQRRLRAVQAQKDVAVQKQEAPEPETDFQRRLKAVQAQKDVMRQSDAQKF